MNYSNYAGIRNACPFEDVNMKLVCHQNYPVPNRNEQGTYTLSAFLYIKESSLRLSACVFIIGPEMKLRLRNMSVHWCPCDWHRAGMSRWATGTGHDATKTFWLQSKHWKLLGIPSWWIQNKISFWWPLVAQQHLNSSNFLLGKRHAPRCDMDMSSQFS